MRSLIRRLALLIVVALFGRFSDAATATPPPPTTTPFLELGASNFTRTIRSNDFTLVVFYAPSFAWEEFKPHFRALQGYFARDSTAFRSDSVVRLARVNVLKHRELSTHSGLNTLHVKMFAADSGLFPPIVYKGSLFAYHIYKFVATLLESLQSNLDVAEDPAVSDVVERFVRGRFFGSEADDPVEARKELADLLASAITERDLRAIELSAVEARGDGSEDAEEERELWRASIRARVRARGLELLDEVLETTMNDSGALGRELNTLKKTLLESEGALSFEETMDMTTKAHLWDYVARKLLPPSEKEDDAGRAIDGGGIGKDAIVEVDASGALIGGEAASASSALL